MVVCSLPTVPEMGEFLKCLLLCLVFGVVPSLSAGVTSNPFAWDLRTNICRPMPLGRVPWILHVRQPDYGWKEHTHKANIALAVNKWNGTKQETKMMGLKLEEEVINALLRNEMAAIHENDLALFIHALIATQINPRNFHGIDLVADLLRRVDSKEDVHPFLVLALCNSHAVRFEDLMKIRKYTDHVETNGQLAPREAEMKALALKAFACAASLGQRLNKFGEDMENAARCLISNQKDGIFGNAYTTSLAVQALTAYGRENSWNEQGALRFLEAESVIEVNMLKAYYIEMALNSRRVKFIKDLYKGSYLPGTPVASSDYHVQYTVKDGHEPDVFFSLTMKVPEGSTFFEVMKRGSELSNRFTFSHYMNKDKEPMVYAVTDKPNDPEENMFWRICRQFDVDHDRHISNITTFAASPVKLIPMKNEHIILWYRSTNCPAS